MKTRYYPVDPERWVEVDPFEGEDPFAVRADSPLDGDFLVELFKRYGVEFPKGASVRYDPPTAQLVVVNTPGNIERIEKVLYTSEPDAQQVYVDLWAVGFPAERLQARERELGRPLRDVEYLELWKQGVGERTFSQGVRTLNGVNATLQTGGPSNPEEKPALTLNVTPTVDRHGRIFAVLLPAQRIPREGKAVPTDGGVSWELATSVAVFSGESTVLGHSSSKDGKRRLVLFFSARVSRVLWKNDK